MPNDYPILDEDLIRRAYELANGGTIHELNTIVGCYRGDCDRIQTIVTQPENLGHLLEENVTGARENEARLRAWVSAQNVKRARDYRPNRE